jgi:hypothetical protein
MVEISKRVRKVNMNKFVLPAVFLGCGFAAGLYWNGNSGPAKSSDSAERSVSSAVKDGQQSSTLESGSSAASKAFNDPSMLPSPRMADFSTKPGHQKSVNPGETFTDHITRQILKGVKPADLVLPPGFERQSDAETQSLFKPQSEEDLRMIEAAIEGPKMPGR